MQTSSGNGLWALAKFNKIQVRIYFVIEIQTFKKNNDIINGYNSNCIPVSKK